MGRAAAAAASRAAVATASRGSCGGFQGQRRLLLGEPVTAAAAWDDGGGSLRHWRPLQKPPEAAVAGETNLSRGCWGSWWSQRWPQTGPAAVAVALRAFAGHKRGSESLMASFADANSTLLAFFVSPAAVLVGYGIARAGASAFTELRTVVFSKVAARAIRTVSRRDFSIIFVLLENFSISSALLGTFM
ncbi:hypothetical protein Taro_023539 [Colocasia esculenta]|uniref:Uncharacterized protein n=1 Tax=Colocasia esculenta TaxID=4460 RepID=A0A843VB35_COLES|nr:hypothetical protein [Colocasia esculenta]